MSAESRVPLFITPPGDLPDSRGRFGEFGGRFVPETLMPALEELERAFRAARDDPEFKSELAALLCDYAGRPTPLFRADRLARAFGIEARVYLKREDLLHTGAHKLNNTLGQGLLARRMGKRRMIAETGAGQHGVASATVAALLGLECVVYMGAEDVRRQAPNVGRMRLLGAEVRPVESGSRTLKDAMNEALRDWVTNVRSTYYCLGSAAGPHPYPLLVRELQKVIGEEIALQLAEREQRLPDAVVACVGGGSNAIGAFHRFVREPSVALFGVEAAGHGIASGKHGASLGQGRPGVLHGAMSYLLQDADGQVAEAHSISAGLDYPGVGPELSHLRHTGRLAPLSATDDEALAAFSTLAKSEGILCALESAHAVAALGKLPPDVRGAGKVVVVNLSGRGDKDLSTVLAALLPEEERAMSGTERLTGAARLTRAFEAAREGKRAALVCYVMAGDPSLEQSAKLLRAVAGAGADVIELGVPFSDPIADGPVLQEAATRALLARTSLSQVLALAAQHRDLEVPMVVMGYLNPILNLGYQRFAREAAAAGVTGAIVPDLPLEESAELRAALSAEGLALVPLVAPTTEGARLRAIAASASGFIYTVSVNGVTGARAELPPELASRLAELRAISRVPVAVGFGVSRPEQARALAAMTDGVVVGSALVRAHHEHGSEAAAQLVRDLRAALDRA